MIPDPNKSRSKKWFLTPILPLKGINDENVGRPLVGIQGIHIENVGAALVAAHG